MPGQQTERRQEKSPVNDRTEKKRSISGIFHKASKDTSGDSPMLNIQISVRTTLAAEAGKGNWGCEKHHPHSLKTFHLSNNKGKENGFVGQSLLWVDHTLGKNWLLSNRDGKECLQRWMWRKALVGKDIEPVVRVFGLSRIDRRGND